MGSYYIPRNLKGESRFLYIFTVKSLITTIGGALIGSIFFIIFKLLGMSLVGIIIVGIFGLAGFGIGAINIPTLSGIPITKKIGGEPLSEIILRWIKFNQNKKIYVYTKEEKKK